MNISEPGLALIKQFEGFSPTPYLCPAGKPTIGYGHVIRASEQFPDAISTDEAESLLKQDVSYTEQIITHSIVIDLTQNQFDALVSLAYNIGVGAFVNSTLLRLLNTGDTQAASAQFAHWIYSNGQKLDGLAARRAAEAELFEQS